MMMNTVIASVTYDQIIPLIAKSCSVMLFDYYRRTMGVKFGRALHDGR